MMKHRGFTLIELMYTLGVAALIMGVGIPTFTVTMQNSQMTASTNTIVTALHAARSEAIKRRVRATVCPAEIVSHNPPTPACQVGGSGLLVFANIDDDATFDTASGDLEIQYTDWVRGAITTTSNTLPGYITYTPNGFTRAIGGGPIAGDLVFCDDRGEGSARVLSVSATGRPQIRKHADAPNAPACPSSP